MQVRGVLHMCMAVRYLDKVVGGLDLKKNTQEWVFFLLKLVAGSGFRLAAPALHWRKSPFVKTSGDRHTAVCLLLVVNHFLRGSNSTQHTFNKKYTAWVYFLLNLVAGSGFEPLTFRL